MSLKNYTTEVSATKSLAEIQEKLRVHNATSIHVNYNDKQEPESLSFTVSHPKGDLPFLLPANIAKVEQLLLRLRVRKPQPWQPDYDQVVVGIHQRAVRVAWRIIKDWVDAQLAIIETDMVKLEEVFMPYMLIRSGQTLFKLLEQKYFLLGPGLNGEDR